MYYILHHSKGTLILSASDKNQVVEWSKRQLGSLAVTASVTESEPSEFERLVERGGTGLQAVSSRGCQPVMSISADMPQCMTQQHPKEIEITGSIIESQKVARLPVWH